jgi:hypothetical protein
MYYLSIFGHYPLLDSSLSELYEIYVDIVRSWLTYVLNVIAERRTVNGSNYCPLKDAFTGVLLSAGQSW